MLGFFFLQKFDKRGIVQSATPRVTQSTVPELPQR
jgi:hypothetical protein